MTISIRIIFPSSGDEQNFLPSNLESFERSGFQVTFQKPTPEQKLPFFSASLRDRVSELTSALFDPEPEVLLCARGGFGAGELLPHLPWEKLQSLPRKWIVGFSDISALHCAFFTKLGWPSIHGPMPATEYWRTGAEDVARLFALLNEPERQVGSLRLRPLSSSSASHPRGFLFGGCLSVLCSLLGTPFFPELAGAILFLEDVNEHPGRLLRYFNQLSMSGVLKQLSGIVLGCFGDLETFAPVKEEIARRLDIPVFSSEHFGHCSPNFPLTIGAKAAIDGQTLSWGWE